MGCCTRRPACGTPFRGTMHSHAAARVDMLFPRQPAEPSWPGPQPSSQTARAPPGPAAGHTTMLTRTVFLAHTAHMHPLKARSPTLPCDQTSSMEQERAHVQAVGVNWRQKSRKEGDTTSKNRDTTPRQPTTPHHTTPYHHHHT